MSRIDQPRMIRALRRYFASGWAFLIPYLAVYLLYYVTDWPVNPASDAESGDIPASAMPSLLHVYWVLHALNLALGAMALWASPNAKSEERKVKGEKNAPGGGNLGRALHHQQLRAMSSELLATIIRRVLSLFPLRSSLFYRPSPFTLQSSLFWLLLALIFYIPGVYLEWPSDPWQHYSRINEWNQLEVVRDHSYWFKSSYFLIYSLIGHSAPPSTQIAELRIIYTICCILLSWQYFKLSRACGLSKESSALFTMLQALMFGNFIFGFYRYYGISSTLFSQLGAVAITRIFITQATKKSEGSSTISKLLPISSLISFAATSSSALTLIAFNHGQGLGIAALSASAIIGWKLVQRAPANIWWIAITLLILNIATALWFPMSTPTQAIYNSKEWLTPWFGFNLFTPSEKPLGAFDRSMGILGLMGIINVFFGILLARRNHIVAWLTLTPLVALSMPLAVLPLSTLILNHNPAEGLCTLPRMLLSIPCGLAIAALLERFFQKCNSAPSCRRSNLACAAFLAGLLFISTTPASGPHYNRLFNAVQIPPADLSLQYWITEAGRIKADVTRSGPSPKISDVEKARVLVASPGIAYALHSMTASSDQHIAKLPIIVAAPLIQQTNEQIERAPLGTIRQIPIKTAQILYSSHSQAGLLSNHWAKNITSLEYAVYTGLSMENAHRYEKRPPQLWLELLQADSHTHLFGPGAGAPIEKTSEDRGALNNWPDLNGPRVGEKLVLRPVLRTLDGNGWRLTLTINGPGYGPQTFHLDQAITPLGSDLWLYEDFPFTPRNIGPYTIDIYGDTLWPNQRYHIRQTILVK